MHLFAYIWTHIFSMDVVYVVCKYLIYMINSCMDEVHFYCFHLSIFFGLLVYFLPYSCMFQLNQFLLKNFTSMYQIKRARIKDTVSISC